MENLKTSRLKAVRRQLIVLVSILIVLSWTGAAPGQLGMGDGKGVAQQRLNPLLVRISGRLQQVSTHPCENTTGKAVLGTHLFLKDKNGLELNIHLGPANEVSEIVKKLIVGNELEFTGFRTDKMPPNHYVAKTLILPNRIIHLRDTALRPYWSTNRLGGKDSSSYPAITVNRRKSEDIGSLRYYPKYGRRCRFQDGPGSYCKGRCRGRACGQRWK
jgi:hypothetical protein